jgi:hypothetical protein
LTLRMRVSFSTASSCRYRGTEEELGTNKSTNGTNSWQREAADAHGSRRT